MTRSGYSFPSGHTMGTLALYGLAMMLIAIYVRNKWLKVGAMALSTAVILGISWSRIHLGVHFFSDILGSLFLGVALLMRLWQMRPFFEALVMKKQNLLRTF